ncbi:MAG: hypothetical protein C4575_06975 [Desulforudis sp.]|nr:MAG: hypothetical protein C4575_06975 [Desulforudis sp.]
MQIRQQMQIRQLLAVPATLRAAQGNTKSPRRDTVSPGDEWAHKRARELQKTGIATTVRRFRKDEPLCVVYRIA